MKQSDSLRPRINFTRSFTLFYIGSAYIVSAALAWTLDALVFRVGDPLTRFFFINALTAGFLWLWNLPFGFPFLSECFPMLAPLYYMAYWQVWAEGEGHYHDPLPNLVAFFMTGLWCVRKLVFWLRSWTVYRNAAFRYASVTNRPAMDVALYGFFHFFVMPLALAAVFSSLRAIVQRDTTLNLMDMVGLGLGLAAVLWDSVAEQQKLLHHGRHKTDVRWKQNSLWRRVRYPEHSGFLLFAMSLLFFTGLPWDRLALPMAGLLMYYLYLRFWVVRFSDIRWLQLRPDYRKYLRAKPPLLPISFLRL